MRGLLVVVVALAMSMSWLAYGQEEKAPAGGAPAQQPGAGKQPGPGGGMPQELGRRWSS